MKLKGSVDFVWYCDLFLGFFYFFIGGCHPAQENNDRPEMILSVVKKFV